MSLGRGGRKVERVFRGQGVAGEIHAQPDEHAALGPLERVKGRGGDDAPVEIVGGVFVDEGARVGRRGGVVEFEVYEVSLETRSATGFHEVCAFGEDTAHGVHAALVVSAEPFEPAHPAGDFPACLFGLRAEGERAAGGERAVGAHDQLGDHGLDEA